MELIRVKGERADTFDHIEEWFSRVSHMKNLVKVLVCNKIDVPRNHQVVKRSDVEQFAQEHGMLLFEARYANVLLKHLDIFLAMLLLFLLYSATTGQGVAAVFDAAVQGVLSAIP